MILEWVPLVIAAIHWMTAPAFGSTKIQNFRIYLQKTSRTYRLPLRTDGLSQEAALPGLCLENQFPRGLSDQ